ncbi:MAG: penicillin acylase family protein [Flavobacterium sp.]|nr:penicillin acylase family protein [Flavobacterium sp.]
MAIKQIGKLNKRYKILISFVLILLVIAVTGFAYVQQAKPTYEGSLAIHEIQKDTPVYFDEFGIPHIYAHSETDAMVALGYVHAQDRLWQMELMRRIAPGRLSEIFGSKLLKTDRFFAGIGIDENSQQAIAQLDKNSASYKLAQAYLQGVNEFIAEGTTPIEFQLLGIEKKPFTLKDVHNVLGFMSFSFAMAHKTDPLLTHIRDRWGAAYLADFGVEGQWNTMQLKSANTPAIDYTPIATALAQLLESSPVPPFIGSNSWVIGTAKTQNKQVIFANDPHIGFSQPGTWYEAHIVTPQHEMYGCYIAGVPYPLLGHNRNYAYGLTMFENDDVDFYSEKTNPNNTDTYQTKSGYVAFTKKTKRILVKDSTAVSVTLKSSVHGPIVNEILEGVDNKLPIAMSWVYLQQPNPLIEAVYRLSHAQNVTEFHQSVGLIAAPGLNVMYGDKAGNIGWYASGKLYKHQNRVNTNFILDGANGKDDQLEALPFSKNPSAQNPAWNYVYSSNNQPEPIDDFLYPGYYLPKDRALRITQLLDAKNNWNKKAVSEMIMDNTSAASPSVARVLLSQLENTRCSALEKEALAILKNWKGSSEIEDIAPSIYYKWLTHYLQNTFEDELGKTRFAGFLTTHIVKQLMEPQLANKLSPWWDNVHTPAKETREQILSLSFHQAIQDLEKQYGNKTTDWTWGKVHQVTFEHPIGKVALLSKLFNVGPFPVAGASEVINNLLFVLEVQPVFQVKAGPSTRRVIDFSDIENGWSILPTGQSGNPFSAHYADQTELYVQGKFRKMKLNATDIKKSSTLLLLKPVD